MTITFTNIAKMPVPLSVGDTGFTMYEANQWYSITCPNDNVLYVSKAFAEQRMQNPSDATASATATLQTSAHPSVRVWGANEWYRLTYANGFVHDIKDELYAEITDDDKKIDTPIVGLGG